VGNGDNGNSRPRALLYRNGAIIGLEPNAASAYAIRITETAPSRAIISKASAAAITG